MVSLSSRSSAVVAAMIVHFLALAANAVAAPPTKFIGVVCQHVIQKDQSYCLKTLSENPSAVAAKGMVPLAQVVIGLGKAHAEKTLAFIDKALKDNPSKKAMLMECRSAYSSIPAGFDIAAEDLKLAPLYANYDVMIMWDQTSLVTDLVGKNNNEASKTVVALNDQMIRFINLAVGATDAAYSSG